MPKLADLPDAIDDDDAVRYHGFADVPGTTLTVHLADDADAFDMSRVIAMVDDYGYDLADSTVVEWVKGSHVVLTFDHVRPPEGTPVADLKGCGA